VLDECDEMLNMGFVDDVEMILNAGGSSENMQTLLFSATLPPWVKDITRRFLRKEQRLVDLVGTQKMKVGPQSCHTCKRLLTRLLARQRLLTRLKDCRLQSVTLPDTEVPACKCRCCVTSFAAMTNFLQLVCRSILAN